MDLHIGAVVEDLSCARAALGRRSHFVRISTIPQLHISLPDGTDDLTVIPISIAEVIPVDLARAARLVQVPFRVERAGFAVA